MIFVLMLLIFAVGFIVLAGGAQVVLLNLNDIIANGPNFWNCFWLLLVVALVAGGSSKAGK